MDTRYGLLLVLGMMAGCSTGGADDGTVQSHLGTSPCQPTSLAGIPVYVDGQTYRYGPTRWSVDAVSTYVATTPNALPRSPLFSSDQLTFSLTMQTPQPDIDAMTAALPKGATLAPLETTTLDANSVQLTVGTDGTQPTITTTSSGAGVTSQVVFDDPQHLGTNNLAFESTLALTGKRAGLLGVTGTFSYSCGGGTGTGGVTASASGIVYAAMGISVVDYSQSVNDIASIEAKLDGVDNAFQVVQNQGFVAPSADVTAAYKQAVHAAIDPLTTLDASTTAAQIDAAGAACTAALLDYVTQVLAANNASSIDPATAAGCWSNCDNGPDSVQTYLAVAEIKDIYSESMRLSAEKLGATIAPFRN